jgi:hypothetical protein
MQDVQVARREDVSVECVYLYQRNKISTDDLLLVDSKGYSLQRIKSTKIAIITDA